MTGEAAVLSDGAPARTSRKWLAYLSALVVAGLLVYAVVVASGGMRDALHQLRHASRIWLLPAVALEMASYAIAGWLLLLLRADNSLRWTTTGRVALVMWGLGSLLPAAPAEGIALSVSELGRRGISRQHAVTMLLVAGWFQFWALVLTAVTVIVVSLARRPFVAKLAADRRPVAPPPPQEDARRAALCGPRRARTPAPAARAAGSSGRDRDRVDRLVDRRHGRPLARVARPARRRRFQSRRPRLRGRRRRVRGYRSCPADWARWKSPFPRSFTTLEFR